LSPLAASSSLTNDPVRLRPASLPGTTIARRIASESTGQDTGRIVPLGTWLHASGDKACDHTGHLVWLLVHRLVNIECF
jgi:hypothetical protein